MMFALINFKSSAQTEFVIKESVRELQSKLKWPQVYLRLQLV